jgi:hypothetical protein
MTEESVLTRMEGAALQEDIPRIMRNDMTDWTKEVAKYRWIQSLLASRGMTKAAEALDGVIKHLVMARSGLLEASSSILLPHADDVQTATGVSDDVHEEIDPARNEPLGAVDCGGVATLLSTVLVRARLATSTGKAKQLIRAGEVHIGGKPVSNTAQMMEPGKYAIRVGDLEQMLTVG